MKEFFQKIWEMMKLKMKYRKSKNGEKKIERKDLKYETWKYKYHFQKYQTVRSLGESIYAGKLVCKKLKWIKLIPWTIK